MSILLSYLKKNIIWYFILIVFCSVFFLIFYLYNLPLEPLYYALTLCLLIGITASIIDFGKYKKSYRAVYFLKENTLEEAVEVPGSIDKRITYYNEIIQKLYRTISVLNTHRSEKEMELVDYYSMWVHQIKTPIAALNFLLDNEEIDVKVLKQELFKIERYVEMVLTYLRLGSETSDYVITKVNLSNVIKENIKKYATLFINKKVKLYFVPHETFVVSDRKWLGFAFEQLLSNAIKYTKTGGEISIRIGENNLIIEDNGIGINEEDLPRIFENGFTGFNGRRETKSSGIGLYLCKRTLDRLGHKIEITSKAGKGTRVEITFPKEDELRE